MLESFEYKGIFWLPRNPEELKAGTLKYTPEEGPLLELEGEPFTEQLEILFKVFYEPIILGITSDGKPVTLEDCIWYVPHFSLSPGYPLYWSTKIQPRNVYLGEHFQCRDKIKFKSISARYFYLDEWFASGVVTAKVEKDKVTVTSPLSLPLTLLYSNDKLKIYLQSNVQFGFTHFHPFQPRGVKIEETSWLRFELNESRNLRDFLSFILNIRDFLTFVMNNPANLVAMRGETENNKKVDIIADIPFFPTKLPRSTPQDILFSYEDVADRFHDILANWLGKTELLQPVYFLYTQILYNQANDPHQQLLSLTGALEALHLRSGNFAHKQKYTSCDKYEKICEELMNAIPEDTEADLRNKISEMLKYGNEKSLRKRLEDIIEYNKDILGWCSKETDIFLQKVIVTRNYYTHFDKNLEHQACKGSELGGLIQKLRLLLKLCLLRESGFTIEDITHMPSIQDEMKFLTGQNEILWE